MTLTDAAERLLSTRQGSRLQQLAANLIETMQSSDGLAVARKMALTAFAIRLLSAVIAFISQIILARMMGEFEYGIFVFVWVLAVILGNLSCLGFHTVIIRFLPQYRTENASDAARGLVAAARIIALLSASVIAASGMLALYLLGDRLDAYYIAPLFIGAFALPMIALGDVLSGIARATGWPVIALGPTYIIRPLLILGFVTAAMAIADGTTARIALAAVLIACWLTTLAQLMAVSRKFKACFGTGRRRIHLRQWTIVALPIFLVEGFYFLLTNADVIIVGLYLSPEKVATYFAAAKTMALVHFVYFAVKAAAAPRFSALFSSADGVELAEFASQAIRWTFWPSLLVGLAVIAVGPFLLSLFGPGFADGHIIMIILFAGIMAKAMIGPGEVLLTMAGEQTICAAVYAAALSVNIALTMLLIPAFGLSGAALATMAAMVAEAILLHLTVRRRLGIILFIGIGAKHAQPKSPQAME